MNKETIGWQANSRKKNVKEVKRVRNKVVQIAELIARAYLPRKSPLPETG